MNPPFWQQKTLKQMSDDEWESLCDGCGRCCLSKIIDEETGKVEFTNVSCRLLDSKTCRCINYPKRKRLVRDCQKISASSVRRMNWLPSTCAYRLLSEGKDLESWHPLVSGNANSVHEAGLSIRGKVISETMVKDLRKHVITWID